MAQHTNYWSCSRFADWLRGTPKLQAGTSDEWRDWRDVARSSYPVRYWIAEEALDWAQDFVTWPVRKLYDIKYYINNRWVTRTHSLTAHPQDIKPGSWRDVGNRFLPCLFNELVDFVEVELAWWHIAWSDRAERAKYNPPFWATGWFRWRTWRCAQAGLDNLEWQRKLTWQENEGFEPGDENIGKPTPQAINAEEILALYKWWTEVYRNRPDPHEASGWSAYCDARREAANGDGSFSAMFSDRGVTPALKKQGERALKLTQKIETGYERENEEMMIRLIKIRNSLWT
jgi:hypothetical protein